MKQLVAVILERDVSQVTKELLRLSALDFISIKEIAGPLGNKIDQVVPKVSEARIGEIRKRIESFLAITGVYPEREKRLNVDELHAVDIDEAEKTLDRLASRVQSLKEEQKNIQQEILKLEDISRQVALFEDISTTKTKSTSFLNIQTGSVPERNREAFSKELATLPSVELAFGNGEQKISLIITMKRDDTRVNAILEKHGWTDVRLPKEVSGTKEEVLSDLDRRIADFKTRQDAITADIKRAVDEKKAELLDLWANLRMNELSSRIQSYFGKTARTYLFSGWVPADMKNTIDEALKRITEGRCYLEWNDPDDLTREVSTPVQVPVKLESPKLLSPFKMIVENYAVPEYGTINPIPFVAVAYLLMFGLMFGDAGHGLVILLIGLIGTALQKKKGKSTDLMNLISYCGVSAIVFGILFGSYFGLALFPAVWFHYHGVIAGEVQTGPVKNIYSILAITIYFGIAVISLGLILNWINRISKRDWFNLFLDKGGILGGLIYGAGVYTGFYFVAHDYKQLPDSSILLWTIGLPMLLLFAKGPIKHSMENKEHGGKPLSALDIMNFFMEWIVEVLEIFSGYLANTLSFMRVAGLGIAHVSLMMAFFQIAAMLSKNGHYTIGSFLVLLAGNALVIALEGLSAGIQSLRLNYYEFFSKYFNGTGRAYAPVSLSRKDEK